MSKVSQWVFSLQEDAYTLGYADFVAKHGYAYSDVWVEINGPQPDQEPDYDVVEESQ